MKFSDLNLNGPLLKALNELDLISPTTIQQKAFSPVMAGKDVLGIAQTGTGKTFAYLLPMLRMWQYKEKKYPEILVVVPTRELVAQVVSETQKLITFMNFRVAGAFGGANIKSQMAEISEGVDLVVATPGRLLDLLLNGTIKSNAIKKLVIDEVDEMLNLGFRSQIQNILDMLPVKRQTLMFTATLLPEVELFINQNFRSPQKIEAAPSGSALTNISQVGYKVPNFNTKMNFLQHLLLKDTNMTKVLIFASGKKIADEIHERLQLQFDHELAVIHGNKNQNTRFNTVEDFDAGKCRILVATDLMARGLDVSEVTHVINIDVPPVAENYMHRIGRTGRAGKKGIAITFVSDADKENKIAVETLMGRKIAMKKMPDEIEISDVLIPEEIPVVNMKIIEVRRPKQVAKGKSHHEKKDKNKKVNIKISREDKKKLKYGKRYSKEHRN
jgi:ATP-dependent RNA helicase RhlE